MPELNKTPFSPTSLVSVAVFLLPSYVYREICYIVVESAAAHHGFKDKCLISCLTMKNVRRINHVLIATFPQPYSYNMETGNMGGKINNTQALIKNLS